MNNFQENMADTAERTTSERPIEGVRQQVKKSWLPLASWYSGR